MFFKGIWSGNVFRVIRPLGQGAHGEVHEVEHNGKIYAVKIGYSAVELQSEINRLQTLSQTQGSPLESYFLLSDDTEWQGKRLPFYVMKKVRGTPLTQYPPEHWTPKELYRLGASLLEWLSFFHREGYIFGDLKPDNILVLSTGEVHLIDYGGLTPMGESVKQFTELYDRGYWRQGERQAEPSYDLFSLAMILLYISVGERERRANRSFASWVNMLHSNERIRPWSHLLHSWLKGDGPGEGMTADPSLWKRELALYHRRSDSLAPSRQRWIYALFAVSSAMCAWSVWLAWGG